MQWPQTGGQGSAAAPTCPADLSSLAPSQALLLRYVSQVARCSVGRWGSKPQTRVLSLPLLGFGHPYLWASLLFLYSGSLLP